MIYIVEQDAHPKHVAYKTIQGFESKLSVNTEGIDREARNWFSFAGHPLVIRPHFIEVWDGVPLICMPYCDGDLSDLVIKELSLTGVVCLSLQIVKGMMVAISRGMNHHQDVKPENLLYIDLSKKYRGFPPSGVDSSLRYSVRIADFGVANAWSDKHLGGTNAYKAPEQHDPSLYDKFDPDVFGVGLVIAELYQGYHPAAKDSDTNVGKWRGSRLKKWSISGQRHFSPAQNPQAQDLLQLVKLMLAVNPSERPTFQQCYDQLTTILGDLSPLSLEQLELTFDYFDYVATYCEPANEIDMLLRLAVVPNQREFVQNIIRMQLTETLEGDMTSLESYLRLHHLADAFHRICGEEFVQHDKKLVTEASRKIVKYVLSYHESITADCLWPAFSFGDTKPRKQASDIEAKAEILDSSITRLKLLGAYDEQLRGQIGEGGSVIQACEIMADAGKLWAHGHRADACVLLDKVRKLVPHDPELEKLCQFWTSARDTLQNRMHQKKPLD